MEHFLVLSLFFPCPSLKSGRSTSIKILFSKLTRADLLLHRVLGIEVENCGLRNHLKLGDFLTTFLQEMAKKHLVVEWLSWLPCKSDFIISTILET